MKDFLKNTEKKEVYMCSEKNNVYTNMLIFVKNSTNNVYTNKF